MDSDGIKFNFSKLNNNNYQNWKFRVKMILIREGNWSVVEEETPENPTNEWKRSDEKAQTTISLSVEDNQIIHICKCKGAKDMWDALKKIHERSNLSNKLYLLRKLYQSRLEGKSMSEYIKDTLELVERLRGVGETIKDFHVAALLLGGLPESYSTLVTALDARPDDELSLEYVKGKLMDESKRKEDTMTSETALKTDKFKKNTNSFKIKQDTRECHYCHRKGHLIKDCFFHKKDKKKENQQVKMVTEKGESEFCFNSVTINEKHKPEWYVDSGATSHVK